MHDVHVYVFNTVGIIRISPVVLKLSGEQRYKNSINIDGMIVIRVVRNLKCFCI